ncbi:TetR/AcrR family transcriptional regulator [Occultella gossypii]|uniref:TetR family transcriptional regulator n=1 Tax=Occultella gossypii TaxID=2800820 RepID=A0ABS7S555_9MICO|nr:TetR/AcrR family transcriptional regulator [Occultella gossypii]MBZ2195452.1 TetR family transcriptional regulator [Occultella gossypii]
MRTTQNGQQTADAIRREAAELFATKGYDATTLRDVAARVGIKVGSLYNHIASKEELLLSVMGHTMDDLAGQMERALAGHTESVDRLIAFLECHIRFHAENAQQVFIGNTELRSLHDDFRRSITEKRRAYRKQLEELIEQVGIDDKGEVLNSRLHAFSIVAVGTHVSGWYRPDGVFSLDEIIETYTKIILRSLQIENADHLVESALAV